MDILGFSIMRKSALPMVQGKRKRLFGGFGTRATLNSGLEPLLTSAFSGPYKKRGYKAATANRLTADLAAVSGSANRDIHEAHTRLVAISRNLAINSDYAARYFNIIVRNVVGDNGIQYRSNVKNKSNPKTQDDKANEWLEASFKEWSKKGNCTVCGKYSFRDLQRVISKSQHRDGEILIRKINGFPNKWGFALQVLEADYLDVAYGNGRTTIAAEGDNKITMSVETNEWGRPVAYHLLTAHPGDNIFFGPDGRNRKRVLADDILHIFTMDRAGQLRGVPHICPSMLSLNHLSSYKETELIAARLAASKMGFYIRDGEVGGTVDEEADDGTLLQNAEPGTFEELPSGVKFEQYNPTHPSGAFDAFVEKTLRGIAAGLDVPYNDLANDLKSVNFSSIRAGIIEARTTWRLKQRDMIESFHDPIFEAWLKMALLTDLKQMKYSDLDRYVAGAKWQPRGFAYINPVQDIKADLLALRNGLTSYTQIAAERGSDYADNITQLAKDLKLAEESNVTFPVGVSDNGENLNAEVNTNATK